MKRGLTETEQAQKLPAFCASRLPSDRSPIKLVRGQTGYWALDADFPVEERNELFGITKAQVEAMLVGSMFGWDVPGANPDNYDENGVLL